MALLKCVITLLIEKSFKNRYRDIEGQEQLSLYVTADQTPQRIALVKGN